MQGPHVTVVRDGFAEYAESRGWFTRECRENGLEYLYVKPKLLLGAGYVFTPRAEKDVLLAARSIRWHAGAAYIICEDCSEEIIRDLDRNMGMYCLKRGLTVYDPSPSYELEDFLRERFSLVFEERHRNL